MATAICACGPQPTLDDTANISCASDDECPTGWACKGNSGAERCIQVVGGDTEAPELSDGIIIEPALGKDGTTFTVCFSTEDELNQAPVVMVDTGAGPAFFTRLDDVPSLCDDAQWAFSYTVSSAKDAAGTRAITVNLTDDALNQADGLALGSFELDFTSPALSSHLFSAQAVGALTPVNLELVFNEPINGFPDVKMGLAAGEEFTIPWDVSAPNEDETAAQRFVATFTPSELESPGSYSVKIEAEDKAGNTLETILAEGLDFDFSPPLFSAPTILPSGTLGPGDFVQVVFLVPQGEVLAELPSLAAEGEFEEGVVPSFGPASLDDGEVFFSETIRFDECQDTDRSWDLRLWGAKDNAGNLMTDQTFAAALRVDCLAPFVTSSCIYPNGTAETEPCPDESTARSYKLGDVVHTRMAFNEEILTSGGVKIGGEAFAACATDDDVDCCRFDTSARGLSCWQTISQAQADGQYTIRAEVEDLVGNTASLEIGAVVVDATAPLMLSPIITPNPANASSQIAVSFSFNEPVVNSNLVADGQLLFVLDEEASQGQNYLYRIDDLSMVPSGEYALSVIAADQAGNMLEDGFVGTLEIDTELPSLISSCIYPPNSSGGEVCPDETVFRQYRLEDEVWISFSLSEESQYEVLLDAESLPACTEDDAIVNCCTKSGLNVDCRRTILAADGTGAWDLAIELTDQKANTNTIYMGTISYDADAPTLLASTITPSVADANSEVLIRMTFNEEIIDFELSSDPDFSLPFGTPLLISDNHGIQFVMNAESLPRMDEVLLLSVSVTDLFGNVASDIVVGELGIDTVMPEVDTHCIYPANTDSSGPCPDETVARRYKSGEDVYVHFRASEEIAQGELAFGAELIVSCEPGFEDNCCSKEGPDFYCMRSVTEDDQGTVDVQVQLQDLAGNSRVESLEAIQWDGVAPSISVFSNGDMFGAEERLDLTLAGDEDLDVAAIINAHPGSLPIPGLPWSAPVSTAANRITWTLDINESISPGSYGHTFVVSDVLGNESQVYIGPFEIDPMRPSIQTVQFPNGTIFSAVDGFNEIRTDFTLSKNLCVNDLPDQDGGTACEGFLSVRVQSVLLTCENVSEVGPPYAYSCSHVVEAIEHDGGVSNPGNSDFSDGAYLLTIDARDGFGNFDTHNAVLTFDFSPPEVVSESTDIVYVPELTNPLPTVFAMNQDTAADVLFVTDERIMEPWSTVRVVSLSTPGVTQELGSGPTHSGSTFNRVWIQAGALSQLPDGQYEVQGRLTDEVGNSSVWQPIVNPLTVDNTAPDIHVAFDTTQIQLLRIPHGSRETEHSIVTAVVAANYPSTEAESPENSVLPSATFGAPNETIEEVRFLTWSGVVIGRSTKIGTDGWGNFFLPDIDYSTLDVQLIDHAGNISERKTIPRVQWVGTIRDKVIGDLESNPIALETRPMLHHRLLTQGKTEVGEESDVADEDLSGAYETGGALNHGVSVSSYGEYKFVNQLSQRFTTLATDLIHGEILAVQGALPYISPGSLWAKRGVWEPMNEVASCSGDSRTASAYNAKDGTVQVVCSLANFDIYSPAFRTSATFSYNGGNLVSQKSRFIFGQNGPNCEPSAAGPAAWSGHAMAYFQAKGDVLFTGGECDYNLGPVARTLSYDGSVWDYSYSGLGLDHAQAVMNGAMLWDPVAKMPLLYGGTDENGDCQAGFFRFNKVDYMLNSWYRWNLITPATQKTPPALCGPAFAYDFARDRAVLYSGKKNNETAASDEVWEWDSHTQTWSQVEILDPEGDGSPPGSVNNEMAFDPHLQRLIVMEENKTWSYTGYSWINETVPSQPAMAVGDNLHTQAAWDATAQELIAMPARLEENNIWQQRTLSLGAEDGWSELVDGGADIPEVITAPPLLVYHPQLERVLAILPSGEVFSWNAGWEELTVTTLPSVSAFAGDRCQAVFDTYHGHVLKACYTQKPLWALMEHTDGGSGYFWQQINEQVPGNPIFQIRSNMAYDETRQQLVTKGDIAGTRIYSSQTGAYQTVTTANGGCFGLQGPPPMILPAMAWHPGLERIVLVGYADQRLQIWTWNGECWTEHPLVVPVDVELQLPTREAAMVYHAELDSLLLIGGRTEAGSQKQVWRLAFDERAHPGHVVHLSFSDQLNSDFPFVLQSAEVTFKSGATGGANLKVWTQRGWNDVNAHDAPFDSPADLSFETPDGGAEELRIMDGLHFAIGARGQTDQLLDGGVLDADGGNGSHYMDERIRTDYMEIRVRYELE